MLFWGERISVFVLLCCPPLLFSFDAPLFRPPPCLALHSPASSLFVVRFVLGKPLYVLPLYEITNSSLVLVRRSYYVYLRSTLTTIISPCRSTSLSTKRIDRAILYMSPCPCTKSSEKTTALFHSFAAPLLRPPPGINSAFARLLHLQTRARCHKKIRE